MRLLAVGLVLLGVSFVQPEARAVSAQPTARVAPAAARSVESPSGIRWEPSLAAARAKAARTGKPLFLLHMFGRLDEEFC